MTYQGQHSFFHFVLLLITALLVGTAIVSPAAAVQDSFFDGVFDLANLDGTNGFVLNGIDAGDHAGISVSNAGDVNGDGTDDLIIGAHYSDPGGDADAGESYVVFGQRVPEPSSFVLLAVGLLGVGCRRRERV